MCLTLNSLNIQRPKHARKVYKAYKVREKNPYACLSQSETKLQRVDLFKGIEVIAPFRGDYFTLKAGTEVQSNREYQMGAIPITSEEKERARVSYGFHICYNLQNLESMIHENFGHYEIVIVEMVGKPEHFVASGAFDHNGERHGVYSSLTPLRVVRHFRAHRSKVRK